MVQTFAKNRTVNLLRSYFLMILAIFMTNDYYQLLSIL